MPISCSGSPGRAAEVYRSRIGTSAFIALVCDRIWKCLSAWVGDTSARETNLCHHASGLVCVAGTPCPSVSRED